MPLKVYVAASTLEMDRARIVMAHLRAHGIEVTSTWLENISKVGASNQRDASDADRYGWSETDLAEVKRSDLIWLLVPAGDAATRGAWLEFGYAHALNKGLVASGDTKCSIFTVLGEEFAIDEDAFARIKEIKQRLNPTALIQAPQLNSIDLRPKQPLSVAPIAIDAITTSEQARATTPEQTRILELADELELRPGVLLNRSQLTPRYLELEFDQALNVFFTVRPSPVPTEPFTVEVHDYRNSPVKILIPGHSTTFEGARKTLDTLLAGIRAKS